MFTFFCKYCDRRFTYEWRYRDHLTNCWNGKQKRKATVAAEEYEEERACENRNTMFATVQPGYRHEQNFHNKDRQFECTYPMCLKRSRTMKGLRRHITTQHSNEPIPQKWSTRRICLKCQKREQKDAREFEEYMANVIDLTMDDDDDKPYKHQNPKPNPMIPNKLTALVCPTCHHILTEHAGVSSSERERCYGCQHWFPKGNTLLTHMTTCCVG